MFQCSVCEYESNYKFNVDRHEKVKHSKPNFTSHTISHTVGEARIVTFLDINLQFLAYNSTYYVISALELTIILDTIHIILHSSSV